LPSDRQKAIVAAYDFVKQHLRYYGSWEGQYGFVPRSCDVVLHNGYGDCKELAMLLCALLRAKGIDASPALVSARSIYPEMNISYPNMGVFNHAIVALRSDSGFRYLDPTANLANTSNSYFWLIGRKTLVLRRGASVVDSVVEASGFTNEISSSSRVVTRANGSWFLECAMWHYGLAAQELQSVLQNRINQTEAIAISGYLKSAFHINAASPTVRICAPDTLCVSFSCPFDECVIKVPHQGFVITMPPLCAWDSPAPDAVDEGPLANRSFVQNDRWLIPEAKTMKTAFSPLNSNICKGWWKFENDTLCRTVVSRRTVFASANTAEFKKVSGERSRFEKGAIWKE